MGFFNALNHFFHFFLPGWALAIMLPTLARWIWRAEFKGKSWRQHVIWTALANAGVLILGLIVTGQDGAMVTYAGLVLVSALMVWWTGLR